METITLAEYLEKNPESKRLQKRFARALKNYMHTIKDLRHATADIAHAKEDCAFAIQTAEQVIEDCRGLLAEWSLPECSAEEIDEEEVEGEEGEEIEVDDDDFDELSDDDFDDLDDDADESGEEVEEHLRHAAKDIGHALGDAESALEGLRTIDNLLFDILQIAEEDGYMIPVSDAKAYLIQKASEAGCQPLCGQCCCHESEKAEA